MWFCNNLEVWETIKFINWLIQSPTNHLMASIVLWESFQILKDTSIFFSYIYNIYENSVFSFQHPHLPLSRISTAVIHPHQAPPAGPAHSNLRTFALANTAVWKAPPQIFVQLAFSFVACLCLNVSFSQSPSLTLNTPLLAPLFAPHSLFLHLFYYSLKALSLSKIMFVYSFTCFFLYWNVSSIWLGLFHQ